MLKLKYLTILIVLAISLLLLGLSSGVSARPLAATAPPLGAVASFSVLADLSMSAAGAGTTVQHDLGLSTNLASSLTGPWTVGGSEYFGPSSPAGTAHTAAVGAFNNLAGQSSDGTWGGGTSPGPGVWNEALDTMFTGTLTLNGDYNDIWVFQVGRDMTFSGAVVMTGNAQPCNVFWQVGRDATIASNSAFVGTLIASRDVTLVSGASVDGRIISLNSSLTTDGNNITGPTCNSPTAVEMTLFKAEWQRGSGVVLGWTTVQEVNTIGFNIYRRTDPQSAWQQVNTSLIASKAPGSMSGADYTYTDPVTDSKLWYEYKVDCINTASAASSSLSTTVFTDPYQMFLPQINR